MVSCKNKILSTIYRYINIHCEKGFNVKHEGKVNPITDIALKLKFIKHFLTGILSMQPDNLNFLLNTISERKNAKFIENDPEQ